MSIVEVCSAMISRHGFVTPQHLKSYLKVVQIYTPK